MDCFVQLTEAYLSTGANPYSEALTMEGLKAVKRSLAAFLTDRNNMEAATDMAFAALTSGICLANAGLGVIHGFASSVGGLYDIPHGVICGSLMAAANEINVRELRKKGNNPGALEKYADMGRLFLEIPGKNEEYYINGFVEYLYSLRNMFPLPRFGTFGMKNSDCGRIVSLTSDKSNPVSLSSDELTEIISTVI
jgi:alcohol dehydrogenase class IV